MRCGLALACPAKPRVSPASTGAVARSLDDVVGRSTLAPSIALPVRRGGTPHRRNRVPNRVPDSAFLMPLRDTHSNEKSCKRTGRSSGMPLVMKRSPVRVRASALGKGLDKLDLGEAAVVRLAVRGGRHAVGTVTKSLGAGVATIRFRRTNRGG